MSHPPLCAAPLPIKDSPKASLPEYSCDTHFHIFDAPSQQVPMRSYTAPRAPLSDYRQLQNRLGFQRSVIVQPSVYGADNQTTMSVCQNDPNMRAIVVIDSDITDTELQRLSAAGAVGCRVNMLFSSGVDIQDVKALAHKIADYGWHIQFLADISKLEDISALLQDFPVPIMFDHMGHMPAGEGVHNADFQRFCAYLAEGRIWTKLSAAYRVTSQPDSRYEDVAAIVDALIAANPEQLVWGSDWPHPQIKGQMPDDTKLVNDFLDWIPAIYQQDVFAGNAAKFYQFAESIL